ncbi:hypothetical protein MRB53_042025 [Persea americana]|nr:hypothetical protein MRB53_042025 [Persea americana]
MDRWIDDELAHSRPMQTPQYKATVHVDEHTDSTTNCISTTQYRSFLIETAALMIQYTRYLISSGLVLLTANTDSSQSQTTHRNAPLFLRQSGSYGLPSTLRPLRRHTIGLSTACSPNRARVLPSTLSTAPPIQSKHSRPHASTSYATASIRTIVIAEVVETASVAHRTAIARRRRILHIDTSRHCIKQDHLAGLPPLRAIVEYTHLRQQRHPSGRIAARTEHTRIPYDPQ